MPFKSRSQLAVCYNRKFASHGLSKWDCDEWLSKTPNPKCLPYKGSLPSHLDSFEGKCKVLSPDQRKVSGVHLGPRGGAYVIAGGVKVYVPHGQKDGVHHLDWVISKYGVAK